MRMGTFAAGRFLYLAGVAGACLVLASCAKSGKMHTENNAEESPRLVEPGEPVPKGGGYYHVGKPYVIGGRTYVPAINPSYSAVGIASWYGPNFHGRRTANGEIFDENAVTAAHPTLPLPSYVRVTNLANHKSMVVRVNDRGPFAGDRVIDLSKKSAQLLGFQAQGIAKVKIDYIGPAPLAGSRDSVLARSLRQDALAELPDQNIASEGQ